jgi:hypothetical protein
LRSNDEGVFVIKGLDKFKTHFTGFEKQYVLIGGTATYLLLDAAGLQPRATKDLDIVLCLETLTSDFSKAFWAFLKEGGYQNLQASTGKKVFYRFSKPRTEGFPVMLELFSRAPDGIQLPFDIHLTPIPTDDEVYSLSAILLDTDYYDFLHQHKAVMDNMSILAAVGLIPLKAKAWLDLSERKEKGEQVDSKNIKKHRTDVINLYQLLTPEMRISAPDSIKKDLSLFLNGLKKDESVIANFIHQVYL